MEFRGTYTPAITPLNEDMSINWNGFDAILEHLIADSHSGLPDSSVSIGAISSILATRSSPIFRTSLPRSTGRMAVSAPL